MLEYRKNRHGGGNDSVFKPDPVWLLDGAMAQNATWADALRRLGTQRPGLWIAESRRR